MKIFKILPLITCGLFLFLIGCGGEKAHPELATPEKTMSTYMHHAGVLLTAASATDYQKVISCFSQADQEWFENNFSSLPREQDDMSYGTMNGLQKRAYAFGENISKAGPVSGKVAIKTKGQSSAVAEVEGFGTINLIKEGPNWKIKGLFGQK